MEKRQTLKEFAAHWKVLQSRIVPVEPSSTDTSSVAATGEAPIQETEDDPFDCSSLAIPPSHILADRVADEFSSRWKDLDQRKISEGVVAPIVAEHHCSDDTNDDDDDVESPHKPLKRAKTATTALPKWYQKHVRLPEGFDYATRNKGPPTDDDGTGDRVVSLTDPSQTTSYEAELWNLFRDIPTKFELEDTATAGVDLPATQALHAEIARAGKTADAHALCRFRMSDRHDLPPPQWTTTTTTTTPVEESPSRTTLRLECLRQQMKRLSTPDSNRMVLEFLGSQSLLDVHRAIVELTDDELWRQQKTAAAQQCVTDDANHDAAATDQPVDDDSGYFFIEGSFYTAGPVDYTSTVLDWLSSGTAIQQHQRLSYLGIDKNDPLHLLDCKLMKDTQLEDLSCRLGVRYAHVHHGDVECSVFCTDRRLIAEETAASLQFPILHDVWMPSYTTPDCDVCLAHPASVATSTTCRATLGHKALCADCCHKLNLPSHEIKLYSVWRDQATLSAGAGGAKTF